eukprot:3330821-Pyramimonas_sp.AAC.1
MTNCSTDPDRVSFFLEEPTYERKEGSTQTSTGTISWTTDAMTYELSHQCDPSFGQPSVNAGHN